MSRQFVAVAVLAGALAVLGAGCGSKKAATGTTTAMEQTTTAMEQTTTAMQHTTTEAMTTSSSSSSKTPSFASTKNCAQLASLASKVAQSIAPGSNGQIDLGKEADAIEALANAAPGDIKNDFKTFADAYSKFVKALASSGYKPGSTPTPAQLAKFEAAAQGLNSPKLQAAEQHLNAWGQKNCAGLK
jgi:hypothetical protein